MVLMALSVSGFYTAFLGTMKSESKTAQKVMEYPISVFRIIGFFY